MPPRKKKTEAAEVTEQVQTQEPVVEVVEAPKTLPVEKFYAKYAVYNFCYPVIGPDGKRVYRTNHTTGNLVYNSAGEPVPIMKMERFKTVQPKMSKGFLSVATFNPNTDDAQELARGEALRKLSKQSDIAVFDEDTHEQKSNYDKWVEKQRRIEAEKTAKAKDAKIAELEKQIAEAEGK